MPEIPQELLDKVVRQLNMAIGITMRYERPLVDELSAVASELDDAIADATVTDTAKEIERLRGALEPFANVPPGGHGPDERLLVTTSRASFHFYERDLARAKSVFHK